MPVSSTKMLTGALEPGLAGDGLLAGLDEQHLEAVDVALGDAVGRVERERLLVVLAGDRRARPSPRAPWRGGSRPRSPARARAGAGSSPPPRPSARRSRARWPARPAAASGASGLRASGRRRRSRGRSRGGRPFGPSGRVGPGRVEGMARRTGNGRGHVFLAPPPRAVKRRPASPGPQARRPRFQATTTTASATSRIVSHRNRGSRRRAGAVRVERVPQVEHQRQRGRADEPRHVHRADRPGRHRDHDRVGQRRADRVPRGSRSGRTPRGSRAAARPARRPGRGRAASPRSARCPVPAAPGLRQPAGHQRGDRR